MVAWAPMHTDDEDLIREVAEQLIAAHGANALGIAIDHEENAREKGHHDDADAWLDIAMAAASMLRDRHTR